MIISAATIQDVEFAYKYATSSERLNHNWIYGVDPETMIEVKKYWKTIDASKSLYNAFCEILKK